MLRSFLVLLCCAFASPTAPAGVIVVTNRATAQISFALVSESPASLPPREFTLASGEVMPIPVPAPAQITFTALGERKSFRVVPNGLYYFGEPKPGQLELGQIGLGMPEIQLPDPLATQPAEQAGSAASAPPSSLVIGVKILFDDAEISAPAAWERRIRARFDEASRIFKKHCFVEFQIVSIESWHSNGAISTLEKLLEEFERMVDPGTARLAIGFTGQRKTILQDPHMGGTRGPLHTHLMIREHVNKNSEAERLEVLVHELGHFLGAVHSPESSSVMRPVLGDRQARAARFRIGFDPLNTLAMCLVSQELRKASRVSLAEMPPATRFELFRIYTDLARAIPDDKTAIRYLSRLGITLRKRPAADEPR